MTNWFSLTMVKRLLAIAVLFFLLYALVDLLFLTLLPLRSSAELLQPVQRHEIRVASDQSSDYWQNKLDALPPPLTRTVSISATTAGITIDLNLWISPTHPLAFSATSGQIDGDVPAFAAAAFGKISIGGADLAASDYAPVHWTVEPDTQVVQVQLQAFRADRDGTWGSIVRPETAPGFTPLYDEVLIQLDSLRLRQEIPAPDEATLTSTVLHRAAPDALGNVHFTLDLADAQTSQPTTTAPATPRESRQEFLERLSDVLHLPFVASLLFSLAEALPLLIFFTG